jgi:hypothetical protein
MDFSWLVSTVVLYVVVMHGDRIINAIFRL